MGQREERKSSSFWAEIERKKERKKERKASLSSTSSLSPFGCPATHQPWIIAAFDDDESDSPWKSLCILYKGEKERVFVVTLIKHFALIKIEM